MLDDFTIRTQKGRKNTVQIVYEDETLLIVNKPAGLRVIPDRWNHNLPNLKGLLEKQLDKSNTKDMKSLYIVHRIDKDTSGLVLFACSPEMHQYLNQEFLKNNVKKTYLAIVQGVPASVKGKIEAPIIYSARGKASIHADGKPSVTEYTIHERFRRYSLLKVFPITGRMHQIRIHLKSINHPLAIDPVYGEKADISIYDIKRGIKFSGEESQPALISRLSLHAWQLKVRHPHKNKEMKFEAKPPKDFQAFHKALKKWDK